MRWFSEIGLYKPNFKPPSGGAKLAFSEALRGAGWAQGRPACALAGLALCVPTAPVAPFSGQAPPCKQGGGSGCAPRAHPSKVNFYRGYARLRAGEGCSSRAPCRCRPLAAPPRRSWQPGLFVAGVCSTCRGALLSGRAACHSPYLDTIVITGGGLCAHILAINRHNNRL